MSERPKTHTCFGCRTEYISNWVLTDTRYIEVFKLKKKYYDYTTKCTTCGHEWTIVESESSDTKPVKNSERKET